MPTLTLRPTERCAVCGFRVRGFCIGSYRINKNELIHDTEAPEIYGAKACEARLRGAGVGQVVVYVRAAGVTG